MAGKFKIGDWIEYKGTIFHIEGITSSGITKYVIRDISRSSPPEECWVWVTEDEIKPSAFEDDGQGNPVPKEASVGEPKYKVGDWVVVNQKYPNPHFHGRRFRVSRVPNEAFNGYTTEDGCVFNERYLDPLPALLGSSIEDYLKKKPTSDIIEALTYIEGFDCDDIPDTKEIKPEWGGKRSCELSDRPKTTAASAIDKKKIAHKILGI